MGKETREKPDTRHRTKTKTHHKNLKDEHHGRHQDNRGEPRCSRRLSSSCLLNDTHRVAFSQVRWKSCRW